VTASRSQSLGAVSARPFQFSLLTAILLTPVLSALVFLQLQDFWVVVMGDLLVLFFSIPIASTIMIKYSAKLLASTREEDARKGAKWSVLGVAGLYGSGLIFVVVSLTVMFVVGLSWLLKVFAGAS
jgi:hypothetical protein